MKKKILIIVSCLILLVSGSVLLAVLLKDDKPMDDEPIIETNLIQLKKPLNLKFDDFNFSWDVVENASSYMVYIDEMEYEVFSNSYDLTSTVSEGSVISVKALGKDQYKNSVKSLELIFRSVVDEEEVEKISECLHQTLDKYLIITTDLSDKLSTISEKIYLSGMTCENLKKILLEIDSLLEKNQEIIKFNKIEILKNLFSDLINIINLEMNEYATVSSICYFFELYCDAYVLNESRIEFSLFDTQYFEEGEVVSNFTSLVELIKGFKSIDIQNITSHLYYYNVYRNQIDNIKNTFNNTSVDNINGLYNDIIMLKNMLCDMLINYMPQEIEYEGFKDLFLNIYNTVSDGYLEDKLTSSEIESYFNNLYTVNEYYLSFLNYLEDSDYKVIVTRGLSFYKSITEEDKTNIKNLISLFDLSNENNILEIIEKHFILNFGNYDFELDSKFKEDISKLLEKDDLSIVIMELIEYFEVGKYISSNEDIISLVVEYFEGLIPEKFNKVDVFIEYIINVIDQLDYTKYIELDLTKLITEEESKNIIQNLFNMIFGKMDYNQFVEELFELIDFEEAIFIDYQSLGADLVDVLKNETEELAYFLEDIISLDQITIQNILLLMNVDAVIDVDLEGLKEHAFSLMDIYVENDVTLERIESFVSGVYQEVDGIVTKLNKYIELVNFFKDFDGEEMTEEDIEKIYQDESLDFMSLFILLDHLNIKYAKFQVNHQPAYEDGLEFDPETFEENVFNFIVYLYYGIHSYAGHEITLDTIPVIEKIIALAKDYQKLEDMKNHYDNLFKKFEEISDFNDILIIYKDKNQFNQYISNMRKEIDYTYNSIKYLCEVLPIEEMFELNYSFVKLINSCGYKNIGQDVLNIVELLDNSFDDFKVLVEELYLEYGVKETAIISLYNDMHSLLDPIEAYVVELKEIYYEDAELSEDDIIDIVSQILMNKNRINEFYKKDLILSIGNNLDILLGDKIVDFNELSNEIIFYCDLVYNRINAHNAVSTTLDLTRILLDILSIIEEEKLILEEIDLLLDDNNLSYEEKTLKYANMYLDLVENYKLIKENSLVFVERYDQFILKGIEELSVNNPEYESRKQEFLITDDLYEALQYFDEFIDELNTELPNKSNLDLFNIIFSWINDLYE